MKKIVSVLILICLSFVGFSPLFSSGKSVYADESEDTISTGIFLPTSYLQYYKLDNPYAICAYETKDEEFVAISQTGSIVIYKNETFASIDVSAFTSSSVACLSRYKNFLLFPATEESASYIYAMDISKFGTDEWELPTDISSFRTSIGCTNSFSIVGDKLVTTTISGLSFYDIFVEDGEFKETFVKSYENNCNLASTVLYSKDGKVYFSKQNQNIYKYDGVNDAEEWLSVDNVRAITESKATDEIYYSCQSGVFSYSPSGLKTPEAVCLTDLTKEKDLGTLHYPQGICLAGEGLWVVDSTINAVQEIDLQTNTFTDFAITTNSNALNRLSENASDLTVDGNTIFALDKNRVVIIDNIQSIENRVYKRVELNGLVKKYSAGKGYLYRTTEFNVKQYAEKDFICFTDGKTLKLAYLEDNEEDINLPLIHEIEINDSYFPYGVNDIYYADETFYILSYVKYGQDYFAQVYSLPIKKDALSFDDTAVDLVPITDVENADHNSVGIPRELSVDVFGNICFCNEIEDGKYNFYRFENDRTTLLQTVEKPSTVDILNLQTDFDGKLFVLYSDNLLECYDGENLFYSKTLDLGENLKGVSPAKSMCLSYESQTAYFIFDGLILKSSSADENMISTPYTIKIPDGFSLEYTENPTFCKVLDGAKIFKVDLNLLDGNYFTYTDTTTVTGEKSGKDYAIIKINNLYSLALTDGVSGVVRNTDCFGQFTNEENTETLMAVVPFNVYGVPVLDDVFKLEISVDKFQNIDIVEKTTFNGIEFFVANIDGNKGYIPSAFLTDEIKTEASRGETNSYYDEKDTKNNVLKSIAIVIAVFSIASTFVFFERKYLFN